MSAVVRVDDETDPDRYGEGESPPDMSVFAETELADTFHDSGETSPDVWHVTDALGEVALGPVAKRDRKWSLQAASSRGGCPHSRADLSSYPQKFPEIIAVVLTASPEFMFTLNSGSGCKANQNRTAHAVSVSAAVVDSASERSRLRAGENPLVRFSAGGIGHTVALRERAVNGDRGTMMKGARLPFAGIHSLRPVDCRPNRTEHAQAAIADTLGIVR